ncbi:MAG: hypothetical protein IPL40_12770 [Proteobacteria bacterium]|nr:hypothetical protein [Pseudomonadota bacterium]
MRRGSGALAALGLLLASACSDNVSPVDATVRHDAGVDAARTCALAITHINGAAAASVAVIGPEDDRDPARSGIQLDLDLQVIGSAMPRQARLAVTELTPELVGDVVGGGVAWRGVTVSSTLTQVLLVARADGCSPDQRTISVQPLAECVFESPVDGARLGPEDDRDPAAERYAIDVVVRTTHALGGRVVFRVDGFAQPEQGVGDDGRARIAGLVVPTSQSVQLAADLTVAGVKRTCRAGIAVITDAPSCAIRLTPAPVTTLANGDGLGLAQDADTEAAGVQTTVLVQTEARADRVDLLVDGALRAVAFPAAGVATFARETLLDGGARSLQAICTDTDTKSSGSSLEVTVEVDGVAPGPVEGFQCSPLRTRAGDLRCGWTAAASGVARYEVRFRADGALSGGEWASGTARPAAGVAWPSAQADLLGLPLGQVYSLGVRARDGVGNQSPTALALPQTLDYRQQVLDPVAGGPVLSGALAAGDFDCDGLTDLAVGDPAFNGGRGLVGIFLGTGNGYTRAPVKTLTGTVVGGGFGARLVALTNFDGDAGHCADLAVQASFADSPLSKVYIFLGRSPFADRVDIGRSGDARPGAELVLQLGAGAGADERVVALADAGSFTGSGLSDLALTHQDLAASADAAAIWVVRGDAALRPLAAGLPPSARTLPDAASVRITGGHASEGFGLGLSGGVSLDQDAYTELLVGAAGAPGGGRVFVIRGAVAPQAPAQAFELDDPRVGSIAGRAPGGRFGQQVAVVGDLDGDGLVEFAASDPTLAGDSGAVYVFNLAADVVPESVAAARLVWGNDAAGAAGDRFGVALARVGTLGAAGGDLDGDGLADLVATVESSGANLPGVAYRLAGRRDWPQPASLVVSGADYVFRGPATGSVLFGSRALWLADVNGDQFNEIVIADPQANQGSGRLVLFY